VRILGQTDLNDSSTTGFLVLPDVEAVTDSEGRYTLDGLPKSKKYVLLADPKPGSGPTHQFALARDDQPGFAPLKTDFDLPRGVILTGQLKDKKTGKPVSGRVFYRPLWSNQWVNEHPGYDVPGLAPWYSETDVWTEADGRFRLTVIPGPGILHVQALERDYLPAKLAAEHDNDEIILLDMGTLKVFRTSGQGGASRPEWLQAYRVLRIPADAKTFTADMVVDPGVSQVVKIVGADGKPVSGAWVLNERRSGGLLKPLPGGAEVTIHALDPDHPRRIFARHDEKHLAGSVQLDGKETGPATLKLEATATVTGRVIDKEGKPLKDHRVTARYENSGPGFALNLRADSALPISTDAQGRFTLTDIPAGLSVHFEAHSKTSATLSHRTPEHTLKPGQTLDLGEMKVGEQKR
jgi:hypothetical protein